jgi:FkbM family methyltransferase
LTDDANEPGSPLSRRLFAALLEACYSAEPGAGTGYDTSREWSNPRSLRAKDALARTAARAGFARRRFDVEPAAEALAGIAASLPGLERTYELLADERSRELLVRLLTFRALGPRHVALPVRGDRLQESCDRIDRELRAGPSTVASPYGNELGLYELSGRSGRVRLNANALAVHEFFELEQYAYRHGAAEVAPERGDHVVDGGAGWGDTALWFADAVGPEGRVVCAEVDSVNRSMIDANLAVNAELRGRIAVEPLALWSATGERLDYAVAGPSSSVVEQWRSAEHAQVETVTVDDLVERSGLGRLDFLKLDVEGAELDALRGAEATLRRDRPKLAVAAYHSDADLIQLPAFLEGLGLGYELYLDHFTPGREETILYARAHQRD